MRVLVAEDEDVTRRRLEEDVAALGHDVTAVRDGAAAWQLLETEVYDALVSDWVMPRMDGPELCRRVRTRVGAPFCYLLLLTVKSEKEDLIDGIMAGADDFMTKPYDVDVLRARLHAADRAVRLHRRLAARVIELEQALEEVKTLKGILPICMYCKSIRNDAEAWERVEEYVRDRSEADFSHCICPVCYEQHVRPGLERTAESPPDAPLAGS